MILFLNKKELFGKKIVQYQLTVCLPDYDGGINVCTNDAMLVWNTFKTV